MVYAKFVGNATPPQTPAQPVSLQPAGNEKLVEQAPPVRSHQDEFKDEPTLILESAHLNLVIGSKSASVKSASLPNFRDHDTGGMVRFGHHGPVLSLSREKGEAAWSLKESSSSMASWSRAAGADIEQQLIIQLTPDAPVFSVELTSSNRGKQRAEIPVLLLASWERSDELGGNANPLEAVLRVEKLQSWQRSYLKYRGGSQRDFIVPRGTSLLTLAERYFCQSIRPDVERSEATLLPSHQNALFASIKTSIAVEPSSTQTRRFTVYAGPRDFFQMRDAGFDQAFPIGMLGKIGLILTAILSWIAGIVKNFGVALILLSAGITFLLGPFTIISFKSMKKMQDLQPTMDRIKEKHAKDPQRINKEMLALFREHKVSPLSGCLPMLLPLPIFFALWSAVNHFVGLRGAKFLWIHDLSLPDRLAKMPFGFDLNLLPILMCLSMYAQSKLSQKAVSQAAKTPFSGPLMSVVFLFMFYQVPSGLVLYWLTNSLVSIFWYKAAMS